MVSVDDSFSSDASGSADSPPKEPTESSEPEKAESSDKDVESSEKDDTSDVDQTSEDTSSEMDVAEKGGAGAGAGAGAGSGGLFGTIPWTIVGAVAALLTGIIILSVVLTLPENVSCSSEFASGRYFIVESAPPVVNASDPPLVCTTDSPREIDVTGGGFLTFNGEEFIVSVDAEVVEFVLDTDSCDKVDVRKQDDVRTCSKFKATLPQRDATDFELPVVSVDWPERDMQGAHATAEIDDDDDDCHFGSDAPKTTVFVRAPPPDVFDVWPPAMCAGTQRILNISGDFFLRFASPDVQQAHLDVNGSRVDRSNVTLSGCRSGPDVPSYSSLERCVNIEYSVFAVSSSLGVNTVFVTNPAPAGCGSRNTDEFLVVRPPEILTATPDIACPSQSNLSVRLAGSGFLRIDGAVSEISIGSIRVDVQFDNHANCRNLTVKGHTVSTCDSVDIILSAADVTTLASTNGSQPAIYVTPPYLSECRRTFATGLITLVPPPVVASVAPSMTCFEKQQVLTITGTDFVRSSSTILPNVTVGNWTGTAFSAGSCTDPSSADPFVELCTSLVVIIPAGSAVVGPSAAGTWVSVLVTNPEPLPCVSVRVDSELTASPPLSLVSAAPIALCQSAGIADVTVTGTGFVRPDVSFSINGAVLFRQPNFTNCVSAPLLLSGAEVCTTAVFSDFDPSQYAVGPLNVSFRNAAPFDCETASSVILHVTSPPAVTAVNPTSFCQSDGGTLTITGTDFALVAEVFMGSFKASTQFISSTQLEATFGAQELTAGFYNVTVKNGGSCETTGAVEIEVRPLVLVFYVDPPVTYTNISLIATVYASGLGNESAVIQLIGPSGQELNLSINERPDRNTFRVGLPEGLEAGNWSLKIIAQSGCEGVSANVLKVTSVLTVDVESVTPTNAYSQEAQAITITSTSSAPAGFVNFVEIPRVYLTSSTGDGQATPVRAVEFTDAFTLTGSIPPTPNGTYDLVVVNPDGSVGVLPSAVRILPDPLPVIFSVSPDSLQADAVVTVIGANFDTINGVNISLECRTPVAVTGFAGVNSFVESVLVDTSSTTPTSVKFTPPMSSIADYSVCVVILENLGDNSLFRYSGISKKSTAGNLLAWLASDADLALPRAEHQQVDMYVTASNRFYYVLGGHNGNQSDAGYYSSFERSSISLFGTLAGFNVITSKREGAFPEPRAGFGIARAGRFIYAVGGRTGESDATSVDTVLRAQVLDPLATTTITPGLNILANASQSNLLPGTFYYRVASTYPASFAVNPLGESLPGELLTVQLPNTIPGMVLELSWPQDNDANGYVLYRTSAPDSSATQLEELVVLEGRQSTRFDDDGNTPTNSSGRRPLTSGSLGQWYTLPHKLSVPRTNAAVVAAEDPQQPGNFFLYVHGGRSNASTFLDTYEVLKITQNGADQIFPEGNFLVGSNLSSARATHQAVVMTQGDYDRVPNGTNLVLFSGGTSDLGGTLELTYGAGSAGPLPSGDLGTFRGLSSTPGGATGSDAAYGGCFFNAGKYFYAFCGGGFSSPTNAGGSTEIQDGPTDDGITDTGIQVGNWNSQGPGKPPSAHAFPSCSRITPFFYIAGGGSSSSVRASTSVDFTVQ